MGFRVSLRARALVVALFGIVLLVVLAAAVPVDRPESAPALLPADPAVARLDCVESVPDSSPVRFASFSAASVLASSVVSQATLKPTIVVSAKDGTSDSSDYEWTVVNGGEKETGAVRLFENSKDVQLRFDNVTGVDAIVVVTSGVAPAKQSSISLATNDLVPLTPLTPGLRSHVFVGIRPAEDSDPAKAISDGSVSDATGLMNSDAYDRAFEFDLFVPMDGVGDTAAEFFSDAKHGEYPGDPAMPKDRSTERTINDNCFRVGSRSDPKTPPEFMLFRRYESSGPFEFLAPESYEVENDSDPPEGFEWSVVVSGLPKPGDYRLFETLSPDDVRNYKAASTPIKIDYTATATIAAPTLNFGASGSDASAGVHLLCSKNFDVHVTELGENGAVVGLFLQGSDTPFITERLPNNNGDMQVTVPGEGRYTVTAAINQGDDFGKRSNPINVDVRLRGPQVTRVALDESRSDYDLITVFFDSDGLGDSAGDKENYVLDPEAENTDVSDNPTAATLLDDKRTVELRFDKLPPGRYGVLVRGKQFTAASGETDPATAPGITDLWGNFIGRTSPDGNKGRDFQMELVKLVSIDGPVSRRGVRETTGPYVEFPEYVEPRPRTKGFNPSDHVQTRVVRLYYFRDAHRAAQIVNRLVQSYNRQGVAVAEQLASKSREDARQAATNRRIAEDNALIAARKLREAEKELKELRDQAAEQSGKVAAAARDRRMTETRLNALRNPGIASAASGVRDMTDAQRTYHIAQEESTLKQILAFQDATVKHVDSLEDKVAEAREEVTSAAAEHDRMQQEVLKATEEEDRCKEIQFRTEVAAAHEDPDTYAPGKPDSVDPVRQVSISVIGEGVIQLRGPMKGVNIIRIMLNQIDAPVGQVHIALHTVQINGEKGERMDSVAGRIEQSIDHARFMTLQSAEMLRHAVAKVASQRAYQCSQAPARSQRERDGRYLCSFFGEDFVRELDTMESEFLMTGNKVLSLHSMDVTSLPSALLMLALAKNSTRMEILHEFQGQLQCRLPNAEKEFLCSSQLAPIHGIDKKHCVEPEPILSMRARFPETLGMFRGEIHGPDTLNPIQREFIRLAQIFKARLVVERELAQRIRERAVIEERIGDYDKELEDALKKDRQTRDDLETLKKTESEQRQAVMLAANDLAATANIFLASEKIDDLKTTVDWDATPWATGSTADDSRGLPAGSFTYKGKTCSWKSADSPEFRIEDRDESIEAIEALHDDVKQAYKTLGVIDLRDQEYARMLRKGISAADGITDGKPEQILEDPHALLRLLKAADNAKEVQEHVDSEVHRIANDIFTFTTQMSNPDADIEPLYREWAGLRETIRENVSQLHQADLTTQSDRVIGAMNDAFNRILPMQYELKIKQRQAETARRPLDHKKFLDMLIDEIEDKYIELLEGTRAQTANIDAYIKRLSTAMGDDFQGQFYDPAFRQVRAASRECEVELGKIESTSILANNRSFAAVKPEATMEFDLPKRDIMVVEAMDGAKALMDEYGALLNDPTFLALTGMLSGAPTATGDQGAFPTVRDVLPGLPGNPSEQIIAQTNPSNPEFGAALEKLIPDPAVYKFETGTGFEVRPVIQPDGQSVVFHLLYLYTTNVREPVRADEKHLGRVKRHYVDTDVQLSNFELREVSRYAVALKAARTSRGVPLLEDIPVAGALFRPLPSDESSLQQNIIMAQATIFPTLFDLMGLRWAPAVADLDPLALVNQDFLVRSRQRVLMNQVFDYSSTRVDEFLQIDETQRRGDLYRTQETIPHVHPNGYQGPGLNIHEGRLQKGFTPGWEGATNGPIPGTSSNGPIHRQRGSCLSDEAPILYMSSPNDAANTAVPTPSPIESIPRGFESRPMPMPNQAPRLFESPRASD